MKLSVIVPAYNERKTISQVLFRILSLTIPLEVIVVDDGSTDGTREVLNSIEDERLKLIFHERNKGKGGAVRTGIKQAKGQITVIQDADLEYDPEELPKVIEPILKGEASVAYGSRFLGKGVFLKRSYLANRFLTFLTNLLFGAKITDMETCYKAMKTEVLRALKIEANRFDMEPEITGKLLKKGYKIREVPIRYIGREKSEGKKIGWKDGIQAIWTLLKVRLL